MNLFEATVGFATPPDKIGYFNDKKKIPFPDPNRFSTNIHGRYTGLDIVPGANIVPGPPGRWRVDLSGGPNLRFPEFPVRVYRVQFPRSRRSKMKQPRSSFQELALRGPSAFLGSNSFGMWSRERGGPDKGCSLAVNLPPTPS